VTQKSLYFALLYSLKNNYNLKIKDWRMENKLSLKDAAILLEYEACSQSPVKFYTYSLTNIKKYIILLNK